MSCTAARAAFLSVLAALSGLQTAAVAQDVPGIEICTRETRLDRRTSCLQSNVEFLQQVIAKNAIETRQRLSAAEQEAAMFKEQAAAANRDLAALKERLAAMQAQIDELRRSNRAAAGPASKK
jgi:predicted  nucleic acid-binding Zn-ribbon protein